MGHWCDSNKTRSALTMSACDATGWKCLVTDSPD